MKKFYPLIVLLALAHVASSQCLPTGTRPVSGTVAIASGTSTVMNVPTGTVVQINCPAANTQYLISLCGTNPGTNVPSGTNDGFITIITANSATTTVLSTLDDGCTNMAAPGYGPPVGTWTAPSAATYFLYLTEYDAAGTNACIADGVNAAYDFSITATAPPSNDLALDSAYLPKLYTSISLQQLSANPALNVGARVRNVGSTTATNVTVDVRIRNLTTNTVVSTQTLTGPASLAAGVSALVPGTNYTPPAVPALYEFRYICDMTQTDPTTTNDTAFRYLFIDSSLLALDEGFINGNIANILGLGVQGILGQNFPISVATSVDTVSAYFIWGTANVGQNVRAVVYNTSAGLPTTQLAVSPNHTVTLADTGGALIPFAFAPNLTLPTGTYFIGIEQLGTVNMGLAMSNQNFITANSFFGVSPYTAWTPTEAANFPGSFIIWVNTKLNCTLVANGSGANPICGANNGSASAAITGASGTPSYLWSNGATSASLSNVGPGTYTVSVSAGGCIDTAQVVLVNNGTAPVPSATPVNATCGSNNGEASVSVTGATGPFVYAWSNNGTTSTITNLSAGNYTVTVTAGNCTATASTFVSSTGGPTAQASNTSNVSCFGGSNGSASASATGGTPSYSYSWSNQGSGSSVSNLTAGTYIVTITDATQCVATASVTITEPAAAVSGSITITDVSCYNGTNGSLTVSASGGTSGYTYTWSNTSSLATASNLAAGNYCVTVYDVNQCSATACQTLNNPTQVLLQASSNNVLCNGAANGTANVIANGGAGGYTYIWSNSNTTGSPGSLAPGNYSVTVADALSCSATASVTITEPAAITLSAECTPSILGQDNGTASATVSGGSGPYSYSWTGGDTTAVSTGLAPGIVNITVTDANNCTATANCEVQFIIGINDIQTGISDISIYPNPSNGAIRMNLTLIEKSDVEISIIDAKGSVVAVEKIEDAISLQQAFNLTNLSKGIYNISIRTNSGSMSKRVVIE